MNLNGIIIPSKIKVIEYADNHKKSIKAFRKNKYNLKAIDDFIVSAPNLRFIPISTIYEELPEDFDERLKKELDMIFKKVSFEDFAILSKKINTLKLINDDIRLTKKDVESGAPLAYYSISNEIHITSSKYLKYLNHEFMHAMSGICKNATLYSGFSMANADYDFGTTFNEAFTEFFAQEFIHNEPSRSNNPAIELAKTICELLDINYVFHLYITCNLKELIDELSKYMNREEVYDMISIFDKFDMLSSIKNNDLFINKISRKKIDYEYNNAKRRINFYTNLIKEKLEYKNITTFSYNIK